MNTIATRTRRGPVLPVIGTICLVVAALIAVPVALTSFMLFDATGTETAPNWVWLCFYGIWVFLIMALLAIPGIWIAWQFTRYRSVMILLIVALSPLIPLSVVTVGLITG